jgi:hypothetical protein
MGANHYRNSSVLYVKGEGGVDDTGKCGGTGGTGIVSDYTSLFAGVVGISHYRFSGEYLSNGYVYPRTDLGIYSQNHSGFYSSHVLWEVDGSINRRIHD